MSPQLNEHMPTVLQKCHICLNTYLSTQQQANFALIKG